MRFSYRKEHNILLTYIVGINTAEHDQTIEITPTFEYNDVQFYDEDLSRKSQSSCPGNVCACGNLHDILSKRILWLKIAEI